jgi:hypothetical protein
MDHLPKNQQGRIVFLAYPSLGILDVWLPVLDELKKRRPDLTFTAILPRPRVAEEIDADDVLIRIGEAVFDEVVYKTNEGRWVRARSFREAKEHSRYGLRGVRAYIAKAASLLSRREYVTLEGLARNTRAVCFDIFASSKADGHEILKHFKHAPCFSMYHGLNVFAGEGEHSWDLSEKLLVYTYSEHEFAAYKKTYGLGDGKLKVGGVPRHAQSWVEKIIGETKRELPPFDRYIFVVSRPAITDYLTPEKKRRALEDIKKIAFDDLDCKVVVKLHPTERVAKNKDSLYEEVFGKNTYGKKWTYSSVHPFTLGKYSLFTVVFYSGVAVDMIALGVVPIERLEVNTAPELSDATRKMLHDYRGRGLVLPAENYEDLKHHALAIMKDKAAIMRDLKPNYDNFFGTTKESIKLVVDDMCTVLP